MMPMLLWGIVLYARVYEGVVKDETGSTLEYVTVAGFNDSTVVASVLTDSLGHFLLDVPENTKSFRFTLTGYQTQVADLNEYPADGVFILKSEAKDLGEVTVTAKPVTFEADRFILNLNADPFAKGKDMSQILQNAPGVIMDRRTLSILGSTGVQVYINDRRVKMSGERLYQYLQSIQSSAVNTVEIIPSAGAEYSASFEGGVIKINLKKIKDDGYNGNVSVSATGGERRLAFNPSFNFGYHTGKTT